MKETTINFIFIMFIVISLLFTKEAETMEYQNSLPLMSNGYGKDIRFYLFPDTKTEELLLLVNNLRKLNINYVIFYDIMPEYGNPDLKEDIWIHPRNSYYRTRGLNKDIVLSKHKMKLLIQLLHENNIKAIYYDQICTKDKKFMIYTPIRYPKDYYNYSIPHFFSLDTLNKNKIISLYGKYYGYDANLYLIKDMYAEALAKTIDELDFDGVFLDSLTWLCEVSSFGRTYNGDSINKSSDDVCYEFISAVKKKVKKNIIVMGNNGVYKDPIRVYPKTRNIIDFWIVEFPDLELIKKIEIYPKRFYELHSVFSSGYYDVVIYQPFFSISKPYIYKYLISIALINGVGLYHKNDYLGNSDLRKIIENYNIFVRSNESIFSKIAVNCISKVKNICPKMIFNCKEDNKNIAISLVLVDPNSYIWDPIKTYGNIYLFLDKHLCNKKISITNPEQVDVMFTKQIENSYCKLKVKPPENSSLILIKVRK